MCKDEVQASADIYNSSPPVRWDFGPAGRVMCFHCGWMAGWLAGQATLECGLFCLSERGVGQGENAIDDCSKEERTSRKCSLSPPAPPLPHSHSLSLSLPLSLFLYLFSVCENLHCAEPLSLRPRSPGTTTALSCPVNTHPSSTGRLRLPGPGKHGATAPILIHIAAPAWMVCVCVSALNGKLFLMWHRHTSDAFA